MLAMNAGPRNGNSRVNQLFLLVPDKDCFASRVVVSVVENLARACFIGFFVAAI